MIDAARKLGDTTFCALDLETTGIHPAFHMIIEVGIIRFSIGEECETFHRMVNPGMKIPDDVIGIHGITDDMVMDAPPIGDLIGEISRMIGDSILVIHNPGFDMAFLGWAYYRNKRTAPSMSAIDTVRLSRLAWPELSNHKLETLCGHLNLELSHHRALDDARACMEVFRHILRELDPAARWTVGDLTRFHGDLVRPSRIRAKRVAEGGSGFMGLRLGKKATITYVDQAGMVTVREIQPREFITMGRDTFVLAHCYLRGGMRYFKMDRIREIS